MTEIWTIKLKTLDNLTHEIEMDSQHSIRDLKVAIEKKLGFKPPSQRLIFKGKQLKDDNIISASISGSGTTIHLLVKEEESTNTIENNVNANTNTTGNTTNTTNTNSDTNQRSRPQVNMNMMFGNLGGGQGDMFGNIFNNLMNNQDLINSIETSMQGQNNLDIGSLMNTVMGSLGNINTNQAQSSSQPQSNTSNQGNIQNNNRNVVISENFNTFYNESQGALNSFLEFNKQQSFTHFKKPDSESNLENKISSWLRNYIHGMSLFLPNLTQLANIIDSDAELVDSRKREEAKDLIKNITEGMRLASETTKETNRLVRSIKFGAQPNNITVEPSQVSVNATIVSTQILTPENIQNQTSSNQTTVQPVSNPSIFNISNMIRPSNQPTTQSNNSHQPQPQSSGIFSTLFNMLGNLGGNNDNSDNEETKEPEIISNSPVSNILNKDNYLKFITDKQFTVESLFSKFKLEKPKNQIFNIIKTITINDISKIWTESSFSSLSSKTKEIKALVTNCTPEMKDYCSNRLIEFFAIEEGENQKLETDFDITLLINEVISYAVKDLSKDNCDAGLIATKRISDFIGKLYVELSRGLTNKSIGAQKIISKGIRLLLSEIFNSKIVSFIIDEYLSIEEYTNILMTFVKYYFEHEDDADVELTNIPFIRLDLNQINDLIESDLNKQFTKLDKVTSFYSETSSFK